MAKPTKAPKVKKPLPFDFVLEALHPMDTMVRPMFGCHAIYRAEKILLILREKDDYPRDNGVWIATVPEHHASLKKDFPTLRDIELFGKGPTTWQNLPSTDPNFERDCLKVCKLAKDGDPRIGKIPKSKKRKAKK